MLVVFETKINLEAFQKRVHNLVRSGILYMFTARLLRLVHKMLGDLSVHLSRLFAPSTYLNMFLNT